ncbi:MAG: hypothetical protein QM661_15305 [Solimonas sp.]
MPFNDLPRLWWFYQAELPAYRTIPCRLIGVGRQGTDVPIGEIAGEVVGGLFRLIGQFVAEIIGELLIRGVGYALWRRVSPSTDPEGWPSIIVGLLFWVAAFSLCYVAYQHAVAWLAADSCLDSGGAYNYQSGVCVHD